MVFLILAPYFFLVYRWVNSCFWLFFTASLQDADRSISEVNLPSLLVITLCRFSYNPKLGKHTKLRTPVKYPSKLELVDKIYSLNAVVVHSGVSLNGGHYYTYAHNLTGNQQWYVLKMINERLLMFLWCICLGSAIRYHSVTNVKPWYFLLLRFQKCIVKSAPHCIIP